MNLSLQFFGGRITGHGQDPVGGFVISGTYSGGGECQWTKIYPSSHDVSYCGVREGVGIRGVWNIGAHGSGGFHIWPVDSDGVEKGEMESAGEELPVLIEA